MMNSDVIEVKCSNCKAANRVSRKKIHDGLKPVCGKCKEELFMESKGPLTITDATFEDEVEKSSIPVLLDCWAPWCGPCKMLAPTIDKLADELAGRVKVAKLNVDENPKTTIKLGVMSIPTLLIYKEGKIVDTMVGMQPKAAIEQKLGSV